MRLFAALLAVVFALCAAAGEISHKNLPQEARQTIALIDAGGPFPYPQDGKAFSNREGRLPKRNRGYYREYTVKTPAARDRGARRIITGRGGEYYYSENHYRTFMKVVR